MILAIAYTERLNNFCCFYAMGSLPNLNELYRERAQRRALERERDLAREKVREREFARGEKDKQLGGGGGGGYCGGAGVGERLPIFLHQVHIVYFLYAQFLLNCICVCVRSFYFIDLLCASYVLSIAK